MATFNVGDKVRIKDRKDWPANPGYRFANAEGTVMKWVEWAEVMAAYQDFIWVRIDKANGDSKHYIGRNVFFKAENLEKV